MIQIDVIWTIGVVLGVGALLVFLVWAFYNLKDETRLFADDAIEQCPYCSYIFFPGSQQELRRCPRCKSFLS